MGLFGSTKIYVSSVLYNLSGDPLKRPNFLKTAITSQVILAKKNTMGETLRDNYLHGPGINLRSFYNWAINNYSVIGVPTGTLGGANNIDRSVIAAQIVPDAGYVIEVQYAEIGSGDYSYWAEQYMFVNYPALVDTAWKSDISEVTGNITITLADTSTHTFTPVGFNKTKAFLYAVYSQSKNNYFQAPVVGSRTVLASGDNFPNTTGYTVVSDTTVVEAPNHRRTIIYERTVYMGQDTDPAVDKTYSIKTRITEDTLYDPTDVMLERGVQTTTQTLVKSFLGPLRMFIYEIGSGNAVIDALAFSTITESEYFPFIPIRLDNKFLDELGDPALYKLASTAYRKATNGGKFSKLQLSIHDNVHLADIDYAYVMYGAALNMLDVSGKEYIYRFFNKCLAQQQGTSAEYLLAKANRLSFDAASQDYRDWANDQISSASPRYGTTRPTFPGLGAGATNSIQIKSNGTSLVNTNLDMKITWGLITRFTGSGLYRTGAKPGMYWVLKGPETTLGANIQLMTGRDVTTVGFSRTGLNNTIVVAHQIDGTHWESLQINDAKHINNIYKNKSVDITAIEALDDAEESGFLIPLHYATFREMSLKNATQLSIACGYVVLNCYKVVKTGFFGSFFFKILIFIVIVAITVVFPPAGGVAGGLLGSAAGVGAALGLTGTLALIVGAALNALAAMLLLKVISLGAVLIFGDKLGALIGTIVGLVALQVGTAFANGQSFGDILHSLTKADNLISITSSVGNGFSQFIVAGANETVKKTQALIEDFNKQSKQITQQFVDEFGIGSGKIDPLELTDAYKDFVVESSASFLERTLLVGSDIAEITLDIVNNFSEYSTTINPGLR